jgi:pantothenate synthetase
VTKLEYLLKKIMLIVGLLGVIIIYGGFFYLLFSGRSTAALPFFLLISPWICVYFGLTHVQQIAVIQWFVQKFTFKKKAK